MNIVFKQEQPLLSVNTTFTHQFNTFYQTRTTPSVNTTFTHQFNTFYQTRTTPTVNTTFTHQFNTFYHFTRRRSHCCCFNSLLAVGFYFLPFSKMRISLAVDITAALAPFWLLAFIFCHFPRCAFNSQSTSLLL